MESYEVHRKVGKEIVYYPLISRFCKKKKKKGINNIKIIIISYN